LGVNFDGSQLGVKLAQTPLQSPKTGMSTAQGGRVKNPTTKLTTDILVNLSFPPSHRENIAAAEARNLAPTAPSTSYPASTSSSSMTTALPPTTLLSVNVQLPQASTSGSATAERSFSLATVVGGEEAEESDHSSESESTSAPEKAEGKKKKGLTRQAVCRFFLLNDHHVPNLASLR